MKDELITQENAAEDLINFIINGNLDKVKENKILTIIDKHIKNYINVISSSRSNLQLDELVRKLLINLTQLINLEKNHILHTVTGLLSDYLDIFYTDIYSATKEFWSSYNEQTKKGIQSEKSFVATHVFTNFIQAINDNLRVCYKDARSNETKELILSLIQYRIVNQIVELDYNFEENKKANIKHCNFMLLTHWNILPKILDHELEQAKGKNIEDICFKLFEHEFQEINNLELYKLSCDYFLTIVDKLIEANSTYLIQDFYCKNQLPGLFKIFHAKNLDNETPEANHQKHQIFMETNFKVLTKLYSKNHIKEVRNILDLLVQKHPHNHSIPVYFPHLHYNQDKHLKFILDITITLLDEISKNQNQGEIRRLVNLYFAYMIEKYSEQKLEQDLEKYFKSENQKERIEKLNKYIKEIKEWNCILKNKILENKTSNKIDLEKISEFLHFNEELILQTLKELDSFYETLILQVKNKIGDS